jgi:hypothetical protein
MYQTAYGLTNNNPDLIGMNKKCKNKTLKRMFVFFDHSIIKFVNA